MEETPHLIFGPFRLDPQRRKLWRGDQPIDLQPKPLAVLQYLVAHPDQVVTKEELLKQVWTGVYVTNTALKVCIRAIREALGDTVEQPTYLETVGREGYRFLPATTTPPVVSSQFSVLSTDKAEATSSQLTTDNWQLATLLVGREAELARLHQLLEKARHGERQVVFVAGDAGIGKTTIVDAFLKGLGNWELGAGSSSTLSAPLLNPKSQSPNPGLWIGRGQCLEQYGEGEAYLPMLEALGQLCRRPGGQPVLAVLQRYAPTWLVQMPALVEGPELESIQRKAAGATRERMLREMAEALEALTTERALVLVLEDLHWSDHSTLDLLAYVAQRRTAARLLVLGTYRPADLILRKHPLKGIKQELQAHGQCEEVRLELLTAGEVQQYVIQRLGTQTPVDDLAEQVYRRTDGNPLFMVNLVEQYLQQGRLEETAPESVQEMIGRQIARLSDEQRQVLEAGSVIGIEFVVAAVAAVLKNDGEALEEVCEELAQAGQFLQEVGIVEWPDGTLSGRYRFRHALYQEVLYQRVAEARRVRLHRMIGDHEERVHGERTAEMAAELAMHFERGRDSDRAVRWLRQAGENAMRRNAPHEASSHFSHGLTLLLTLPDKPERMPRELALQIALGTSLMLTKGFAAAEVREVYARARELCQQIGETPQIIPVLRGLWSFYNARAEFPTSRVLAEQLLRLTEDGHDVLPRSAAHMALGVTAYFCGDFALAQEQLEQGITLFDPRHHNSPAVLAYGPHPGLICLFYLPLVLWTRGYPDEALRKCEEGLSLARQLAHPHSQAFTAIPATILRQFRREHKTVQEQAAAAIAFCREHGFSVYALMETILHGWALTQLGRETEGIAQMRQSLVSYQVTGAGLARPYFLLLLAEAYGEVGQFQEGLTLLEEALAVVHGNGERTREAELYRIKGELLLKDERGMQNDERKTKKKGRASSPIHHSAFITQRSEEAEACFRQAIELARQQQAKSLELRATISLARLWQQQTLDQGARSAKQGPRTKLAEAHSMLSKVYGWFTEGFDTKDLREAKVLLETLRS